jgi:hypothetical protein
MANLLSPGTTYAGLFGPDAILSASGVPVPDTGVTVYQSDGTTSATLYTDETKTTTTANPVFTDAYGNLTFYVDPGLYVLSFTVGGVATTKTVMVAPFFPDSAWNTVLDTTGGGGTTFAPIPGDSRICNASAGAATYTLPTPSLGAPLRVVRKDDTANACTLNGSIAGPGLGGGVGSVTLSGAGQFVELEGDGSDWNVVAGAVVGTEGIAIGGIFISGTASTAAAVRAELGYGTWTAQSAGRFLVGVGSTDASYTIGLTGGNSSITISQAQLPASATTGNNNADHTHNFPTTLLAYYRPSGAENGLVNSTLYAGVDFEDPTTSGQSELHGHDLGGSSAAIDARPPFIAVYIWQRTA